MLELYFNIFEYIYNNYNYYYNIYVIIYKLKLFTGFYSYYWSNLFLYYIHHNKILSFLFKPILLFNFYLKNYFIWFNRRFLKKRKRFRAYYKFHNVRYWKFFLFLLYINVFIILWKKRNLYRKSQLFFVIIFLHISILISLHFFMSIFNSYNIAVFFCILFFWIMALLFSR